MSRRPWSFSPGGTHEVIRLGGEPLIAELEEPSFILVQLRTAQLRRHSWPPARISHIKASPALVTRCGCVGDYKSLAKRQSHLFFRVSEKEIRKSTASAKRFAQLRCRSTKRAMRFPVRRRLAPFNRSSARYAPSPSRCALTRRRRSGRQPPSSRTSRKPRLLGGAPAEHPPELASRTKSVI